MLGVSNLGQFFPEIHEKLNEVLIHTHNKLARSGLVMSKYCYNHRVQRRIISTPLNLFKDRLSYNRT